MNQTVKRLSVLMTTAFVDMIGFAIVFPLLPFYALRLDAQEWMIGWMIAVFSIMQLASAPLWGRVSDRYGRRGAIILGLSTSAIAFVVFGFAANLWLLFLSRAIQGIGGGTTGVLQAYVGDVTAPKDRAKALGWLSAATSAGVMIGPGIGSLAVNLGYAAPGLIASGLCLVNMWFAWRWLPESQSDEVRAKARDALAGMKMRTVKEAMLDVLLRPRGDVARLIWIYALGMLGFMSMNGVLALYLEADFGVTEATIGIFFVYVGALSIVMRAVILGKLIDWLGEAKVMRIGAVGLMAGLLLMPFPNDVIMLAIVIALIPIGTACLFPATTAQITHRAPDHERGQTLSVAQSFGGMSRVIGPIWSTAVFGTLGIAVPFYIAAGIGGLVVLLAFRVRPVPEAEPVEA
jgi:MFS family permease